MTHIVIAMKHASDFRMIASPSMFIFASIAHYEEYRAYKNNVVFPVGDANLVGRLWDVAYLGIT